MPTYRSFEELVCWKKCRELRIWVDWFLKTHVGRNDLDMQRNLRKAARSTTRNIAEGFGRFHYKENVQFCRICRGSLFEIKDDLLTCVDEEKVTHQEIEKGLVLIKESIQLLNGYIRYLNNARNH